MARVPELVRTPPAAATGGSAAPASLDTLARSIRERRAILFVGAGLSMSVGLPSWADLVEHLGKELGLPGEILSEPGVTYQTIAEYYRLTQGSIGPLRSWMDRHWHVPADAVRASTAHEIVVSLDFPIVYTTNYDRNLEAAYEVHGRDFVKIVNARDIAQTPEGVTQIVKFHGDFDDDGSLVVAETDYFNRLTFDSPLDIKFRADALGKTVLFIGYSMSDTNIRLILHRLWQAWNRSGYDKHRPQSYVFMSRPNVVQEAVLAQWGVRALTGDTEDPEEALVQFLRKLKERVESLE